LRKIFLGNKKQALRTIWALVPVKTGKSGEFIEQIKKTFLAESCLFITQDRH